MADDYYFRKKTYEKTSKVINEWVGKKLHLPDTLNFGSGRDFHLTIATFIDGNCSVCIDDLDKWKTFIHNIKNVNYTFYVNALDYDGLLNYVKEEVNFPLPLINDVNNAFYVKNRLSSNKMFQTFLLNENDEVLIVGNPLYSEKLAELYKQEIKIRNK